MAKSTKLFTIPKDIIVDGEKDLVVSYTYAKKVLSFNIGETFTIVIPSFASESIGKVPSIIIDHLLEANEIILKSIDEITDILNDKCMYSSHNNFGMMYDPLNQNWIFSEVSIKSTSSGLFKEKMIYMDKKYYNAFIGGVLSSTCVDDSPRKALWEMF